MVVKLESAFIDEQALSRHSINNLMEYKLLNIPFKYWLMSSFGAMTIYYFYKLYE